MNDACNPNISPCISINRKRFSVAVADGHFRLMSYRLSLIQAGGTVDTMHHLHTALGRSHESATPIHDASMIHFFDRIILHTRYRLYNLHLLSNVSL